MANRHKSTSNPTPTSRETISPPVFVKSPPIFRGLNPDAPPFFKPAFLRPSSPSKQSSPSLETQSNGTNFPKPLNRARSTSSLKPDVQPFVPKTFANKLRHVRSQSHLSDQYNTPPSRQIDIATGETTLKPAKGHSAWLVEPYDSTSPPRVGQPYDSTPPPGVGQPYASTSQRFHPRSGLLNVPTPHKADRVGYRPVLTPRGASISPSPSSLPSIHEDQIFLALSSIASDDGRRMLSDRPMESPSPPRSPSPPISLPPLADFHIPDHVRAMFSKGGAHGPFPPYPASWFRSAFKPPPWVVGSKPHDHAVNPKWSSSESSKSAKPSFGTPMPPRKFGAKQSEPIEVLSSDDQRPKAATFIESLSKGKPRGEHIHNPIEISSSEYSFGNSPIIQAQQKRLVRKRLAMSSNDSDSGISSIQMIGNQIAGPSRVPLQLSPDTSDIEMKSGKSDV
ncbi:uncharacterized protein IL334_002782 [Kwoniella shivajii]|uniref:Uncharacterized protein n=1 Tax=Kwoniella shivajii TaxID=564305 RepID=A0ABZ1CVN5_9TREE|nr:hypothetical protein IL334_002782 [Kwoniella shivajii]